MKKYTAMILTCSLLLTLLSIPVGAVNSHQVEEMDAATDFYETYWIIENGVLQQISEETYLELLIAPILFLLCKRIRRNNFSKVYGIRNLYSEVCKHVLWK